MAQVVAMSCPFSLCGLLGYKLRGARIPRLAIEPLLALPIRLGDADGLDDIVPPPLSKPSGGVGDELPAAPRPLVAGLLRFDGREKCVDVGTVLRGRAPSLLRVRFR